MEKKQKEEKYINLSQNEKTSRKELLRLFQECPIHENEILGHLPLFQGRMDIQNILLLNDLYQKILDVHGIIIEFGTRFGKNLPIFMSLRGTYEPLVRSRKIVAFDTFEGFIHVDQEDGDKAQLQDLATAKGYEAYLDQILAAHEQLSPIAHLKKYELVKGDASVELRKYLERCQETIIAMIYFDMDLFKPTKECLEIVKDYVTKGTIIAFDQLCYENFPGETQAVREVFGLSRYAIKRTPYSSSVSYFQID